MGLRIILLLLLCSVVQAQVLRSPTESTTNALATFADATGKRLKNNPGLRSDGTNIFSDGYLTLSGQTNQIGDNGTALTYNGTAVGGGGDTVWTNDSNVIYALGDGDEDGINYLLMGAPGGGTFTRLLFPPTFDAGASLVISNGNNIANSELQHLLEFDFNSASGNGNNSYVDGRGFFLSPTNISGTRACLGIEDRHSTSSEDNEPKVGIFEIRNGAESSLAVFSCDNPDGTAGTYEFADGWLEVDKDSGDFTSYGLAVLTAGVASTDTTAAVNIAVGGWTNTFGKNAVVYLDGTGLTYTVYNNAGTAVYTNAATVTHGTVLLQTSGKVLVTSGTGVTGVATPL